MRKNILRLNYVIIPLFVFLFAFIGSLVTRQGMDWYEGLILPSFTPSGAIISSAWSIIFVLTAISVLIYWSRAYRNLRFVIVISIFIINAILNVLWSYLFFGLHFVGASILEMIFLEATIITLIVLIRRTSRIASILLYPYAIWVIFATFLAYNILLLNI
jgi:translocator protein